MLQTNIQLAQLAKRRLADEFFYVCEALRIDIMKADNVAITC